MFNSSSNTAWTMTAHREWRERPADQRYRTLEELHAAVTSRKNLSQEVTLRTGMIKFRASEAGGIEVVSPSRDFGIRLNNWSFGQAANLGKAPAGFLRELPAPMTADIMNERIRRADRESYKVLAAGDAAGGLIRAFTSDKYARVYDADVVDMVRSATAGTSWTNPMGYEGGVFGAPLVPSGLYASDRDVFMFMVDESRPLEVRGDVLKRGFIVSNSEVGAGTYKLLAFLYRVVCGNNIVHGGQLIAEVNIRHIGSAEERARAIVRPILDNYIAEDPIKTVRMVERAMAHTVARSDAEAASWLQSKGFGKAESARAVEAAVREEGGAGSLWNIVQGLTAEARKLANTDMRVEAERAAGELLEAVA